MCPSLPYDPNAHFDRGTIQVTSSRYRVDCGLERTPDKDGHLEKPSGCNHCGPSSTLGLVPATRLNVQEHINQLRQLTFKIFFERAPAGQERHPPDGGNFQLSGYCGPCAAPFVCASV